MQLGSKFMSFYYIFRTGILRENNVFGIWVFESKKERTIVRSKKHRPKSDRCPYTEQIHKLTGLLGDGGGSLRGLTTVPIYITDNWGKNLGVHDHTLLS
jgi:hypothetical protein